MEQATQDPITGTVVLDTQGVDMSMLIDEYRLSKSYVEQYTRDFPQLDNLVDATPNSKDSDAPFVGDTTLSGLVRSIPRRSLKQLPVLSVRVNGSKTSIKALLCTYLLKKTSFNEDTFGKGLLSTLQIGTEQAISHGYAPFLVATGQMYSDFGTKIRLLHFSDASLEPGVSDANESGYHYIVAHLTKSRVKKILKSAEANENTAWNIPALQQVLESTPRTTSYSRYSSDVRKNNGSEAAGPTYEFVTRYEVGPGGQFITFCPEVSEAPLRVINSRSKWGYPRVQYLVIDPAALIPFGVSRVRLASPNQNLMNIYYGNIAAMLLLNSKPPLFKKGVFTKPVSLKQGKVWETTDPNATVELKTLDNGSLSSFTTFASHFASQMQNIMGGQTMSVNAGSKSSGFSKTAPGVKQSQEYMTDETNQITKILENFLRQYGLVALDTLFSEQEGEDVIIVDDETKDAINLADKKSFVPSLQTPTYVPLIGDDNKITVNWSQLYEQVEEWSVEVDVSTSPDELHDQKRADLQDMLVVLAQNAQELGPGAVQKVQEITNLLLQDKAPSISPIPEGPIQQPQLPGAEPQMQPQVDPRLTQM